ncbi:MAG: DUF262 domain-containing protein [Caldilineaceae bacterium]
MRDSFDSMYKGFPVGYLLFWANGVGNGHRQIRPEAKQKVARLLLIVDGQQRLTSLFAVLKGLPVVRSDYSQSRIFIAFRPKDQKFDVDVAIQRDFEYISDISALWSGELTRNRFVKEFIRHLRDARPVDDDEEDELTNPLTVSTICKTTLYRFRTVAIGR